MSRFNTGNPLGSGSPLDLDDNAKNMDLAMNSQGPAWTDRFGVSRSTLAGQEDRFDAFIESSGYQFVGDYAAGIELTEYNQLIRDSGGEFWRVSGQIDLPYTTTGSGVPESDALVSVGDAVIRQELANPEIGASMVGFTQIGAGAVDRVVLDKLRETVSILDFGVVGDGIADDTDALQAAFDYCAGELNVSTPFLTAPGGLTCLITRTVEFTGSGDLSSIVMVVDGSSLDVAFKYGGSDHIKTYSQIFKFPRLRNTTKPVDGWGSAGIGIQMFNCNQCEIHIPSVQGFTTGILAGGASDGFAYNNVHLLLIHNNKVNLHIMPAAVNGWANENAFYGGRFSHESNATTDWAGTRNIVLSRGEATNSPPNNNLFLKPSLESNNVEYMIDIQGSYNTFINGRYEGSNKFVRIYSETQNQSKNNIFFAGYEAVSIVFTYAGPSTSLYNAKTMTGSDIVEGGGALMSLMNAVTDSVSGPHIQGFSAGVGGALNKNAASTDWSYRLYTQGFVGKRTESGFPRMLLDWHSGNPSLMFGAGASEPGVGLGLAGGSSAMVFGDALLPSIDSGASLGISSFRWSQVFSETGSINTSDARAKQQVESLSDKERAVAVKIKGLIRSFKFNDAVELKGDEARIHFGVMAQDVAKAFESEGLDPYKYALFCYDEWDATEEGWDDIQVEYDEEGNEVTPATKRMSQEHIPAGNRYGIRYEELLAFVISTL